MQSFPEQYALLKSAGFSPLAAVVEMCRSHPGYVSMIEEWFALQNPDAGRFRERWLKCRRAEARGWKTLVGSVDDGCYQYVRFSQRPLRSFFIRWEQVGTIYIADCRDFVTLEINSSGPKYEHLQAQTEMIGFGPLLQEVSQRFFGARDYLENKYRRGAYRKLRVWPD